MVSGTRLGVKFYGLEFFTRSYPFLTELFSLFHPAGKKVIPDNIYDLLSPVALAHLIMGDGNASGNALVLSTDCYSLSDVVRLMNVLIIRYELVCTLHKKRENQYRIYISSRSMPRLKGIVVPYMHETMLYKLNNG